MSSKNSLVASFRYYLSEAERCVTVLDRIVVHVAVLILFSVQVGVLVLAEFSRMHL